MFLKRLTLYTYSVVLVLIALTPLAQVLAVSSYDVVTYAATNICQGGATLNGYVNPFFTNDTVRWFEWGASRDFLPNQTNTSRNGDNTEYFQQDVYNLAPQTMYYFRVVAQNSKGLGRGDILSFKTEGSIPCPVVASISSSGNTTTGGPTNSGAGAGNVGHVSQSVITKPTTNIIDTSAILNAVALPVGSTQTYGWFEWGGTPDLGNTSIKRYLGVGSSLLWSEVLSGLTPGTTYFFKPVIENQNGTSEGALFSFHTTGAAPAIARVVLNSSNITTSVIKQPAQDKIGHQMAAVVAPSDKKEIKVEVIPSTDTVAPKERISETIQFENTTGVTMKNVTVRAVIPCDAVYVPTGGDEFVQNGTMLTHKVGDVKPKEKVSLLLWLEGGTSVADKTAVETIAVVDWDDKVHSNNTESVGRATVAVDKNKIAKESVAAVGSVKSTDSIFPKNLKDWGTIIGFMFLLFAAYIVFLITREKKEEEVFAETEPLEEVVSAPIRPSLNKVGVPQRNYIKDPFVSDNNIQKRKTIAPIVPVKKSITEKGAPPENLPI